MRHVKTVLLGLLLSLTVFSFAQVKPTIDRTVHFEVSENSVKFSAKGGSKTLAITASDPWKIKSNNASWCIIHKEDRQLTITAQENLEFSSRSGYFVLECESETIRIDVRQRAAELYLTLSTQNLNYEASGGTKIVTVTTNGSWSIGTNNYSWVHLSKEGNLLSALIDSNPNTTERSGWFTVKAGSIEKQVDVLQNAEAITLSLSQQELIFDASGGTNTITVTTNTSWSIGTGMVSWGHLTQEGNALKVSVDQNTNTSSRTDWFEIKAGNVTKRVNVSQGAAPIALSLSSQELNFEASGGTKTITITTNSSWSISTDMVSWGHLSKDGNVLRVRLDPNTSSSSRTDWFKIKAGDVEKRVNVTQKGCPDNTLSKGVWRINMRKTVDYVTQNLSNGAYKGQTSYNGSRNGFGVYWWQDGTYYWGGWKDDDENGYAIYICPEGYIVNNCPNCVYYVGNWRNDSKSGNGTCYDKYGNLIYYGDFSNDRPKGAYPNTGSYSSYKFECIEYTDGSKYVGETKDGKRHGYGIYIWKNGDVWYGPWEDGMRKGYGIKMYYNGSIKYGRWTGDSYSAY